MKKTDIVVGATYSNGKGRIRKIIAEGPQYTLYDTQNCEDNLRYEVIHDGTKKNKTAGKQSNITRTAFSSWAKERIE